jgi:hypothetical protein
MSIDVPEVDIYNIDGSFDYAGGVVFNVGNSVAKGSTLFSNVSGLAQGFSTVLTYTRTSDDAPETFNIHLANNGCELLCVLTPGVPVKVTANAQMDDLWYTSAGYFTVSDPNKIDVPTPTPVEPAITVQYKDQKAVVYRKAVNVSVVNDLLVVDVL